MKKAINVFIISFTLLCACSPKITPVYKTNGGFPINKTGFVNLENNILNSTYPHANEIYIFTVSETLKKYVIDSSKYINEDLSYNDPDLKKIIELCKENDLDGIIMAKLGIIVATYDINYNTVGSSLEAILEIKIIDKDGDYITSTNQSIILPKTANTIPSEQKLVHVATQKALKKLAKTMGYKKAKH